MEEESISEPSWIFDQDIKDALVTGVKAHGLQGCFNIQKALKDQHARGQEDLNLHSKNCFGDCNCNIVGYCQAREHKCKNIWQTYTN